MGVAIDAIQVSTLGNLSGNSRVKTIKRRIKLWQEKEW